MDDRESRLVVKRRSRVHIAPATEPSLGRPRWIQVCALSELCALGQIADRAHN